MNDYIDYYELLGIKKNATSEEIKKAYRIQAKKWHPDINKDKEAPNISKELNKAKEILLDDSKRRDYDQYLEKITKSKYQKINKNQAKTNKNTTSKENYNNYSKETYTKWQYFNSYLKYYDTSNFRKILAVILVLIETIICGTLQILNYILALLICYLGNLISYLAQIITGLYIILLLISIISKQPNAPNNIYDWFIAILIVIIGGTISIIPEFILKILIEKMPVYLANINIYLFKKAVGYKEYTN